VSVKQNGRKGSRTKPQESADSKRDVSEAASEPLQASAAGLLARADPLSLTRSLGAVAAGLARQPARTIAVAGRWAAGSLQANVAAFGRVFGQELPGPVDADGDRRFADPTWKQNPAFFWLEQQYLLLARVLRELPATAALTGPERRKADFALGLLADSLAPTNFLATNPAALKRAFETGGVSTVRGVRNLVEDIVTNDGYPRQVDRKPFTVGKDLAATPGKVVYRNRLIELLQYGPRTETVAERPLVFSPPWINKYYVMDLAPGKSFAEWAVGHGHTVFALSYRNPDASLRDLTLDDYLTEGLESAVDVAREITGADQVDLCGLCLGGTLASILLARLAARGDADSVATTTLLNCLVDFSEPGPLGVLTDAEAVEALAKRMGERGYLDKKEMAHTFTLLRANDLLFNYVTSGWLMGESPPAFDILAWNDDATRMPARMHSQYLRSMYLENRLARGELELAGTPLDLSRTTQELYIISAEQDHITPWRSCYRSTQLFGGTKRFVLTSSGHIAGIVNPPGPKRRHWTNEHLLPDPDAWLAGADVHDGSWWEDWAAWMADRAGSRREPPLLGSTAHPPLGDAPGTYVLET
jgi:polyhydroxyalkanoate synthase